MTDTPPHHSSEAISTDLLLVDGRFHTTAIGANWTGLDLSLCKGRSSKKKSGGTMCLHQYYCTEIIIIDTRISATENFHQNNIQIIGIVHPVNYSPSSQPRCI